jgi:predicted signal transduction protein with EAL and GGDEF domain
MYAAKAGGKDRYELFHPDMHEDMLQPVELEAELRHVADRDQLVLHYQPILELVSGRITRVEALVRWDHPTKGLLPPPAFIPPGRGAGADRADRHSGRDRPGSGGHRPGPRDRQAAPHPPAPLGRRGHRARRAGGPPAALGCRDGQGYRFARPLPVGAMTELLATSMADGGFYLPAATAVEAAAAT